MKARPIRTAGVLCLLLAPAAACSPPSGGDDEDAPEPTPGPDLPTARVTLGPERVCADPWDTLRFDDLTETAGVGFAPSTPDVPTEEQLADPEFVFDSQDVEVLGGIAAEDFDGDGVLDLIFTDAAGPIRWYRGRGDRTFERLPARDRGLDAGGRHLLGASAADYDGDGDPDLLLAGRERVFLFENRGDRWADRSAALGLPEASSRAVSAAWADVEGDGDLDVYVANYGVVTRQDFAPGRDHFLVRSGDRFEDRIDEILPEEEDGFGFLGGFFDAEGDGDLDLYVVNDLGPEQVWIAPNTFLRNDAGELTRDPGAQLDVSIFSMGLAVGDYDGDGDFDLHVSNAGPSLLLRNDAEAGFTDVSLELGELTASPERDISWATQFADVDLDGTPELWTSFGWMPTKVSKEGGPNGTTNARLQPDALLSRVDGEWIDRAPEAGVDTEAATRTGLFVDLDGDGFLDLLSWSLDEGPRLSYARCTDAAWLEVRLELPGGNRDAIGARVEAHLPDGRVLARGIRVGSTGAMTSGPPVAHFGLGDADSVALWVHWPDGTETWNPSVGVRRSARLAPR